MGRNIEIKARVTPRRWDATRKRATDLAGRTIRVITQIDTFFRVPDGRLKLRDFGDGSGELIAYRREDRAGPKASDYTVSPTASPATLREALSAALGIRGVVSKTRELWVIGQTRAHLDTVEGLGQFLELEVVLESDQSESEGRAIAEDLMKQLGVRTEDLVSEAYIDLLEKRRS